MGNFKEFMDKWLTQPILPARLAAEDLFFRKVIDARLEDARIQMSRSLDCNRFSGRGYLNDSLSKRDCSIRDVYTAIRNLPQDDVTFSFYRDSHLSADISIRICKHASQITVIHYDTDGMFHSPSYNIPAIMVLEYHHNRASRLVTEYLSHGRIHNPASPAQVTYGETGSVIEAEWSINGVKVPNDVLAQYFRNPSAPSDDEIVEFKLLYVPED